MEFIRGWILSIVSVIIIVSFIEIILPENSMKKFINLAIGFIIILVVITPMVKIVNSEVDVEEAIYTFSGDLNKEEYIVNAERVLMNNDEQFLDLYKDRIKEDVKFRVENKYDVKIKSIELDIEREDRENLGNIRGVKILVEESSNDKTIPIVQIDVSDIEKELEEEKIQDTVKANIVNDLSTIYNLKSESIIVSE